MNHTYQVLLADADNTLFDFLACEKDALHATLTGFGLPSDEKTCALYIDINEGLWRALERKEISFDILPVERFRLFLQAMESNASPEAMSDYFIVELGKGTHLMPGALAFAKEVSKIMPIYIVTNGIAQVQKSRLQGSAIAPYIEGLLISEEVGAAKPNPKMIFDAMELAKIQDRSRVIMLGDSIPADLGAAKAAQVDFCLLQKKGPLPEGAKYQAETLKEALPIVLGQ